MWVYIKDAPLYTKRSKMSFYNDEKRGRVDRVKRINGKLYVNISADYKPIYQPKKRSINGEEIRAKPRDEVLKIYNEKLRKIWEAKE